MDIRLSVIIPGFNNKPEWWRRSVGSVRKACGLNDEIICVDDGSHIPVDRGWLGADLDGRVKLMRIDNSGLASARNVALDQAKGKYVAFVDSDDEVNVGIYEKCLERMEETNADVCVFGVDVSWLKEGIHKVDKLPDAYFGKPDSDAVWMLFDGALLNYSWNKIYRRDFLQGRNSKRKLLTFHPQGMPCEDIMFNLECIVAGATWVNVDSVGYNYYRTDGSLLSRYNRCCVEGLRLGAAAWKHYADTLPPDERSRFEPLYQFDEKKFIIDEWKNIWRKGTPYSLVGRWLWLKEHKDLGGAITFLKTAAFFFARKNLYFKFIRRWHIKRVCPNAEDIK